MAEQHPDLDRVLTDWAYWSAPSETTVKRTLSDQCILSEKVVTVVQGVRCCGKSTLLSQLQQIHKIPSLAAVHISFEDQGLRDTSPLRCLIKFTPEQPSNIQNL